MDGPEARYSLVSGEGDGSILGLAAGDTAGGAWELGYSAITEQAAVISYHLIDRGEVAIESLGQQIRELDGSTDEEPVYRAESPQFRAWLDRAVTGRPVPTEEPSLDNAARAIPLGVSFRRDPEGLVRSAIDLGRLFHADAESIVGGVLYAAGAAAACFGQAGRDFLSGIAESAQTAAEVLSEMRDVQGLDQLDRLLDDVTQLSNEGGRDAGTDALDAASSNEDSVPWRLVKAGLVLSAPMPERYHSPIEEAARLGGSQLGSAVGGIVGARVGIRAWPWAFANDTWFAEIGRRLVRGPKEIRDLPIPYAVEQHLITGDRPGFH